MGLDQAGRDKPAAEVEGLARCGEVGLNGGDAALVDADVGRRALAAEHAGIAQDEVHGMLPAGRSRAEFVGAINGSDLKVVQTAFDPIGNK